MKRIITNLTDGFYFKKFDDEKARPFVNGVLNSVKNEILGAENA